jgi:hypothetical protein
VGSDGILGLQMQLPPQLGSARSRGIGWGGVLAQIPLLSKSTV